MDDIDFVITWVNGADSEWLTARQEALRRFDPRSGAAHSEGAVRYRDLGTLRYWFRAVEQNAPWVRRIHFVTECRLPDWLRVDHPKLHIVDGRAINPTGATTFNSHAVEACIPFIPGLAEKFVYFNDDFFVSNPVAPQFYFKRGLPYGYPFPTMLSKGDVHSHAMLNAARVVNQHFERADYVRTVRSKLLRVAHQRDIVRALLYVGSSSIPPPTDVHVPTPLLKPLMCAAFEADPDLLDETRRSAFRSVEDVAPIYLAMMWHLASGNFFAVSKGQVGRYLTLQKDSVESIVDSIGSNRLLQFCINDGKPDDFEAAREGIVRALNRRWSRPSTFEVR